VRGFQAPGCAQDLFVTEEAKIVPLPASFTFEPYASASQFIDRAGDRSMKVFIDV
jgi:hypothetical protein